MSAFTDRANEIRQRIARCKGCEFAYRVGFCNHPKAAIDGKFMALQVDVKDCPKEDV